MREDDPLGKYINSPETPIYVKSRSLYGLCQSKEAIRAQEFAVLVEGYADLISVYQAGVENIVASSGTALTEEQIQLIARYAKAVTLVYDADSAGSKATIRGVDLIIENGLDVSVATLPAGEDPDSFVKKNGGEAFRDAWPPRCRSLISRRRRSAIRDFFPRRKGRRGQSGRSSRQSQK